MPFNGSGVFQRVRNWVADATADIKIRADYHDQEDDGFAAGLTNCITRDGQSTITQNIPFNNRRITNLQDPVNDQDAATKASSYAINTDKVFKAGDTMTGNLKIDKATPVLRLEKDNLGLAAIVGQVSDTLTRWSAYFGDDTAEAGSNAGSNFQLTCYDDAGAVLGVVLFGDRATGLLKVKANPTDPLGIATKQYVDSAPFQPYNAQLFAGIPIRTPSFPYTPIDTDAQKCIVGSGALTLPTNAAVPYPTGTCISMIANGGNMTIAAGSGETLYWQDGFTVKTGTRTMLNVGMATVVRLSTSVWVITGTGMT